MHGRRNGRVAAQGIRALVNDFLSKPDLRRGGSKLSPALSDHELGLFELIQSVDSDSLASFHD